MTRFASPRSPWTIIRLNLPSATALKAAEKASSSPATRVPSDNLILFAKGADILIHEACLPEYFDEHDTPEVAARLKQYHTSAEDAGKVAQSAGVKMLVLTHLVPGNNDQAFLDRAGKYYKGKIVVGHDLMRF